MCPIAGLAERPENPSDPPHFSPTHSLESCEGARVGFVGLDESIERASNCVGEHREFRSALLLFQNHQRLIELRTADIDLLAQDVDLRVLAPEAKNRGSSNIGMIDIPSDQATEVVRIFTGTATSTFMQKEPDPVDVFEDSARSRRDFMRISIEWRRLLLAIARG